MRSNFRAVFFLPFALSVSVLFLGNCTRDEPLGPNGGPGIKPTENSPARSAARFWQGNDSSSEDCMGSVCVIQGESTLDVQYVPCNQGGNCADTFYWNLLNMPPGVTDTFVPEKTVGFQTTDITIRADAEAPNDWYWEGSESPILDITPDLPFWPPLYDVQVLCSLSRNQCGRIQIVHEGESDTTVVSGQGSQTTFIGKRMDLRVQFEPGSAGPHDSDGFFLVDVQWYIDGPVIEGRRVEQQISYTDPVPDWKLQVQGYPVSTHGVRYYYTQPGTYTVRVEAKVVHGGGAAAVPAEATVTYLVKGPTNLHMTSAPNPDGMTIGPVHGETGTWLHYGGDTPTQVGIRFKFKADVPAGGEGQFSATQLVNGTAVSYFPEQVVYYTNDQRYLDNCPIYANHVVDTGDTLSVSDSPGIGLNPNWAYAGVQNEFRTYFMYRPYGFGNIWVPIGRIEWSNFGFVERDSTAPLGWVHYMPPSTPDTANPPVGEVTTIFPAWGWGEFIDVIHDYECMPGPMIRAPLASAR